MANKSHPMVGGESFPATQIADGAVPVGPGSSITLDFSQITTGVLAIAPVPMTYGDDDDMPLPLTGAPGQQGPPGPAMPMPVWMTMGDDPDLPLPLPGAPGTPGSTGGTGPTGPAGVAGSSPLPMTFGDDADDTAIPMGMAGSALQKSGGVMYGVLTIAGIRYNAVFVNDVNYTVLPTDCLIIYTALTASRTVNVPLASTSQGQSFQVWDGSGSAGGSNGTPWIMYAVTGADKVNGSATSDACVTIAYGQSCFVPLSTGGWLCQIAPLPLNSTTVAPTFIGTSGYAMNWKNTQTFVGRSTSPAVNIANGMLLGTNTQALSATLVMTGNSAPVQLLSAVTSDQTVTLPDVAGFSGVVTNTGTTLNLLVTPSGGVVWKVLPGKSLAYTLSGSVGALVLQPTSNVGPMLVAKVDLTGLSAIVSANALYTVPALGQGMYHATWTATITQAATSSSILSGTTGFQVTHTDVDTGTVITPPSQDVQTGNTNTIGTQLNGDMYFNAKASTAATFTFGYTSTGATPMKFAIHVKLFYLGT